MNMALKIGKVTKVAPIDKMSVVITVVLSMLIFKDLMSSKGLLGVILIDIGGILIALFKKIIICIIINLFTINK